MNAKLILIAAFLLCLSPWCRGQNNPRLLGVHAGECVQIFPNSYHYDINYLQIAEDRYQIELLALQNCSATLHPYMEYRNDSLILYLDARLPKTRMREPSGNWLSYTEYATCDCSFCITFVVEGIYEPCRVAVDRFPDDGILGWAKDLCPENCAPHIPSPYSVYEDPPLTELK